MEASSEWDPPFSLPNPSIPDLSANAMQSFQAVTSHTDRVEQPSVEEVLEPPMQFVGTSHVPSGITTTSASCSRSTESNSSSTHQPVLDTSHGPRDVRWWLSLTLQEIHDFKANDDLHSARILTRRCAGRISRSSWAELSALTLQNFLTKISDLSMSDDGNGPINCEQSCEEWVQENRRYCIRLMQLQLQNKGTRRMVSVHFSIWHISGTFPEYIFESRLRIGAETSLSTDNQAHFIAVDRHSWEKTQRFVIDDAQDMISESVIELPQNEFLKQPTAAFLRNSSGHLALSVSKLYYMHRTRLRIQDCSDVRPTTNISLASRARITGWKCLPVRVSFTLRSFILINWPDTITASCIQSG